MELEHHQIELRHESLRTRSAQRERRLLASISDLGQTTPVVVVHDGNNFVLIDGYKRMRALRRLGHNIVTAIEWTLPERDALMFERILRAGEADSAIEQGWFLREMHTTFGLTHIELARRFSRTPSWVSRRIALVSLLPESVQTHVRNGAIGSHAAMKFLVPMARANIAACAQLADAIAPERLTDRQVGELYAAYHTGNRKARELVLSAPLVALRARDEAARDKADTKTPIEVLLDDLSIATAVARRAHGRLRSGALTGTDGGEQQRVRHACSDAFEAIETVKRRIDKEMTRARSEHADSHTAAP